MSIYSILSLLETRDEGGNDEDFTITYAKLMVVSSNMKISGPAPAE